MNKAMSYLIDLTLEKPKTILVICFLATALVSLGLGRLTSDPDFSKFLPADHPAKKIDDWSKETFGLGKSIFIGIENEVGVFNRETLQMVADITEDVHALDGVIEESIVSLATERNIVGTEDGLTTDFFMEEVPGDAESIAALRHNVMSFDLYVGNIVSSDETMVAVIFDVRNDADTLAVYDRVKAMLEKYQGGANRVSFTGDPIASGLVGKYIGMDMGVMMPSAAMIVLLMLLITFRNMKAVALPFAVISLSVVWSMGVRGLWGIPMNMLSPVIPIILMAIGDTDGIHILSAFYHRMIKTGGVDRRECLRFSMNEIARPVVLTSVTTALGFLSLAFSPIMQIRHFGIFTAVGVMAAMFISLFLVPPLILLFKINVPASMIHKYQQTGKVSRLSEILAKWGQIAYSRVSLVGVMFVLVLAVSAYGVSLIRVDDRLIDNFKKSTDIYQATKQIDNKFNGSSLVNVVLKPVVASDRENFFQRPENLKIVEEIQVWAKTEFPGLVGDSISLVDFLKKIRSSMNRNDTSFAQIPPTEEETAQYLLLYGLSGQPEDFEKYVTSDYGATNVLFYLKEPSYTDTKNFHDSLIAWFVARGYDANIHMDLTGENVLNMIRVSLTVNTLWVSLLYSSLFIFIVTSIMFRSVMGGFLNLFTVGIALLINFAIMGFLGITIAVGTAIISSIIIGVGVDFSIHIISRYQLEIEREKAWNRATEMVMTGIGGTLFISAIVIILGFTVLLSSQLPATITIGSLVSLAMLTSFLVSIFFLPLVILLIKPFFIQKQAREAEAGIPCPGRES